MVSPLLKEGTSFLVHIASCAILIRLSMSVARYLKLSAEYYGHLRSHKRFLRGAQRYCLFSELQKSCGRMYSVFRQQARSRSCFFTDCLLTLISVFGTCCACGCCPPVADRSGCNLLFNQSMFE